MKQLKILLSLLAVTLTAAGAFATPDGDFKPRNWFIGAGGGVNIGHDGQSYVSRELSHWGAGTAADFYIGKYFGRTVGFRIGYQGFGTSNLYTNYDRDPFQYYHADLLFRAGNVFVPYVHAGYARLAAGSFAGGLGVMIPVPLGKRVSIVPDLKVTALSGTAFSGGTQRLAANFSATLGLRIRLGKLDRPSKPLPPVEPVNLPVVDTVTQVKTVVDTVKVTVIERIKEVVEQPAPKPDYPEEHVVQFDYTSSQLQNRYLPMLDAWAAYLASHPDVDIVIFGYTCDIGSDETNDVLSFKRAAAVRDHLTARGINPARITVHGYGESNPVAPNDTEANRSLNRRAEIFIH